MNCGPQWEAFLDEIDEYLSQREDVRDGEDGVQLPNQAMNLLTTLRYLRPAVVAEGAALQAAIAEVVVRARRTLIEQRAEFERGDLGDLDALEDALAAYDALVSPRGTT